MSDKQLADETGRKSLDPKHSAVSLPPASFDIVELQKGLDHAAGLKPENREASIGKALEKSVAKIGDKNPLEREDPASMPGHRFVEVEHPELGVIERTQVYDPKLADEAREADEGAEKQRDLAASQAGTTTGASAPKPE